MWEMQWKESLAPTMRGETRNRRLLKKDSEEIVFA
jgi:hypothetical protein